MHIVGYTMHNYQRYTGQIIPDELRKKTDKEPVIDQLRRRKWNCLWHTYKKK